jgi:DNA gyrase subunit A
VAGILAFQPDEHIAQVIDIRDYEAAPYLVLSTRKGLVKKTPLTDYDSNRSGGIVAINLREDDELIAARLVSADDDLLLVSRKAMSIRFHADDEQLRPMGRQTSGVLGMRVDDSDELLAMVVVHDDDDLLVATPQGMAKRTLLTMYSPQRRGGKGILTADLPKRNGRLVGAMAVTENDEVFAITSTGGVLRTVAKGVRRTKQRQTSGVRLMNLPNGVEIVAIARNAEQDAPDANGDGQPGKDSG